MRKIGHWATHEYHRRAVIRDVEEFVGFDLLKDISTRLPEENIKRNLSLFATTFLTGGRIEEVLELEASNFEVAGEEVIVRDMRLLKRYEKTGSWTEYVDKRPKNKLARLFEWDEEKRKSETNFPMLSFLHILYLLVNVGYSPFIILHPLSFLRKFV